MNDTKYLASALVFALVLDLVLIAAILLKSDLQLSTLLKSLS